MWSNRKASESLLNLMGSYITECCLQSLGGCYICKHPLGKGVYSQLGNMHWKVDEHLKYLINFPKRKYSLEI